jgi:hypothetical protein
LLLFRAKATTIPTCHFLDFWGRFLKFLVTFLFFDVEKILLIKNSQNSAKKATTSEFSTAWETDEEETPNENSSFIRHALRNYDKKVFSIWVER